VNIPRGKPFSSNHSRRPGLAAEAKASNGKALPHDREVPAALGLIPRQASMRILASHPRTPTSDDPREAFAASRGDDALLTGLSRRSSPAERPLEIARLDTMEIGLCGRSADCLAAVSPRWSAFLEAD
jgi:hypothetical protein